MKSKLTVLLTATLALVVLSVALSHRAETAPPAPSPFVGTWQTSWDVHYPPNPGTGAPITVKAETGDPNALDGVVEVKGANGVMFGKVTEFRGGWTWTGNWWNTDGTYGGFSFTITNDNKKHFNGTYWIALDKTKTYKWTGDK